MSSINDSNLDFSSLNEEQMQMLQTQQMEAKTPLQNMRTPSPLTCLTVRQTFRVFRADGLESS